MQKGKVPGNTVFIDCMGEEEAGKSCREASMTDKPFVEGQESMEGVKVKMMISQAVGHGTDWKELKSEEERQAHISKRFAREFVVHEEQQSSTAKPGDQEQSPQARSTESDLKANVNAKASGLKSMYAEADSHPVGYEHFKLAKEIDRNVHVAINVMEKNKEEMRKFEETTNVTMMDRGGQDQFLSTHAALMADNEYQCTTCFVVIDGSKPLDEKVTTSKFRLADGTFIEKPRDVATTRADVIRHCFTALSAAFPAGRRHNTFLARGVSKGHQQRSCLLLEKIKQKVKVLWQDRSKWSKKSSQKRILVITLCPLVMIRCCSMLTTQSQEQAILIQ